MGKQIRVGIVGVSGYGGGELLRYISRHPNFELTYACAGTSAGKIIQDIFSGFPASIAYQEIEKWDARRAEEMTDLVFLSLPTGKSKEIAAEIPDGVRVVDLGGDHRFVDGWVYGLPDIYYPHELCDVTRVANPGCYPTAAILALAPLLENNIVDPENIVINAVSGLSGMGRGDKEASVFADMNEDTAAYGFFNHPHVPELHNALRSIAQDEEVSLTFVPQYIPMTRGISVVCIANGEATTAQCIEEAKQYYDDSAFVRVLDEPPHTKYAAGSNFAFVSYVAQGIGEKHGKVIALAAIDNLGKGAAGQAIQNANIMCGLNETTGLKVLPLWP